MQTPVVPFWYKNDKVPDFGKPKVESTSKNVCAIPTCPIIFVFACVEKFPYVNGDEPSGKLKDPSKLTL